MNSEQKAEAKFWINALIKFSPTQANYAAISFGPLLWDSLEEYSEFKQSIELEAYRKGMGE